MTTKKKGCYITSRGFERFEFTDRYKNACSLQQSSLATEPAIWLGCNDNRMHLTRPMVVELVERLTAWLDSESFEVNDKPSIYDGWIGESEFPE